ncbi:energy transducer TonB [Halomonas denitrificans]|nr:energy transducer TonB [Halomonas denitrificans]
MGSGLRYLISLVLAVVVTLAAFYFMHKLISNAGGDNEVLEPPPGIRFGPVEIDDTITKESRKRPEPPPPPEEPPPPPDLEIAQVEQTPVNMPQLDLPDLNFSPTGGNPVLGNFNTNRNAEGDVVPLVRIQPQYPRDAAMNQIEGYVRVQFTITETGAVTNPRVIDAEPPRVFDRAALRAILRWKFKPRIVDGVAVARTATQTIDFNLDGS